MQENNLFFTEKDNFISIINNNIKDVISFCQIQTGWTNFVFRVISKNGNFIFRFPRNNFFANALIKEFNIVNLIKDKISIETPNFKLKFNKLRPYTIHKEIKGESLSSCYNLLSSDEKQQLAVDICNLLSEFYTINVNNQFEKVSNFLDNLSFVSKNNYDITKHNILKEYEKENLVFSHGDFNPGNLILKNNKLVAIIDFSFSGTSTIYTDLSRIIGRCPKDFKEILIKNYEKLFITKLDTEKIRNIEDIWAYVEKQYILYIKQNHPDIILPNLV